MRQAAEILRASHIAPQFHGFVEGHDIAAGTTDVVVTDGFTGNVALKTGEGALKLIGDLLRQVFRSSLAGAASPICWRGPGLDRLREWLDPRRYNGAVMLGLNGVVVKSHGGTDAEGFAHAVDVAMDMVVHRFNDHIREDLARIAGLGMAADGDRTGMTASTSPDRPAARTTACTRHRSVGNDANPIHPRRRRRATCPSASSATTNWRARSRPRTQWIRERTGIRQRHIAGAARDRAFMGTAAARAALAACRGGAGRGGRHHPGHQHARTRRSPPPRCGCRRRWA